MHIDVKSNICQYTFGQLISQILSCVYRRVNVISVNQSFVMAIRFRRALSFHALSNGILSFSFHGSFNN